MLPGLYGKVKGCTLNTQSWLAYPSHQSHDNVMGKCYGYTSEKLYIYFFFVGNVGRDQYFIWSLSTL